MNRVFSTTILIILFFIFISIHEVKNENKTLSRKKRYVVFPEGSTFSFALCMTQQTLAGAGEIFTEGLNWGLSYDLPNDSRTDSIRNVLKSKPITAVLMRKRRSDLYQKLELIIDSMGFDGKSCLYKALCETAQRFMPKGNSLVEEILRVIFRFPLRKVLSSEPSVHHSYHWAHRTGKKKNTDCNEIFKACPFSILDMALGYYSV